jgi:hypothetical protein
MSLFTTPIDSSIGSSQGSSFIIGRVQSIVLGEYLSDSKTKNPQFNNYSDLGKITFEILYSTMGTASPSSVSKPAYPIHSITKQYPLIGEIVLIVSGPSRNLNESYSQQDLYYYPPFNIWRSSHHNVFPNLAAYSEYEKKKKGSGEYPNSQTSSLGEIPMGYTFTERSDIKNIRPFEGDSIIEGRFGQSIRFGSTVSNFKSANPWSSYGNNGIPITIITNGYGKSKDPDSFATTIEDISFDDSCIYLTSGQYISIQELNDFPFDSFGGISTQSEDVIYVERTPVITSNSPATEQDKSALNV